MSINRRPDTGRQRPSSAERRWLALYGQSLPAIYGYIFSQVGNREDAERLTTRVFTEAAHRLPDPVDLHAALQALHRLARETVDEHLLQFYASALVDTIDSGAEPPLEKDMMPAATGDAGRADSERAEQVLARLPAPARDLLTYRLLAGQSLEATAAVLLLSVSEALKLQYEALHRAGRIMFAERAEQPSPALVCCQVGA